MFISSQLSLGRSGLSGRSRSGLVSFSVMPSLRNNFGSLVRWIITGAPLHGCSNMSEKRGWPGPGLWVSLSVLRLADFSS